MGKKLIYADGVITRQQLRISIAKLIKDLSFEDYRLQREQEDQTNVAGTDVGEIILPHIVTKQSNENVRKYFAEYLHEFPQEMRKMITVKNTQLILAFDANISKTA